MKVCEQYCIVYGNVPGGALQTTMGLFIFLLHIKDNHYFYHGAVITEWKGEASISLGLFVFVSKQSYFYNRFKSEYSMVECFQRLLVHEYGHTIKSLILGPLYLIVIGIPSMLWAFLGSNKRKMEQIPYGAFFTEKWANKLGGWVTGEKSIGDWVLD